MTKSQLDLRTATGFKQSRPERDAILNRSIPGICAEWFPDNDGNIWHIKMTIHIGGRSFVLVRPEPDDVGYDHFVVLITFNPSGQGFSPLAMYCQHEDSLFGILSTAPNCPKDIPSKIYW